MDDEVIQKKIAELDMLVPRDGAQVRFEIYGGGPDESRVEANKTGYLRLGIEFLKGAYLEPKNEGIPIDIEHLVAEDSDIGIDWFKRSDTLVPTSESDSVRTTSVQSKRNKGIAVLFAGLLLLWILLTLIGVGTVIRWITT